MKVRIIKCTTQILWYHAQIGLTCKVESDCSEKVNWYYMVGSGLPIRKEDCEILPEEAPQPEPFDLERALKGEEMTSIDGREKRVYLVGKSNNIGGGCYILEAFYADRPPLPIYMTETDMRERLQMAPKQPEYKTVWVNLYSLGCAEYFDSFEEANGSIKNTGYKGHVCTSPITFKVK